MPPTSLEAAVMVAASLAALLAGALLLLLLLLLRRRHWRRPHHDHAATASQHLGYSTTGALAAVAVYVARLLLARAVNALLAAVQLLVAHAATWLLRCSSTATGDAAKLPSAGSDGASTLSGCGGLRPLQLADGAPAPPATQQQQQTPAAAWCSSTGTSSSSALRQPTSSCLLVPALATAPAVGQTGTSSSRLAHCSTPCRSRSHGLQLGAAAAPAWADATAYVAVADHTAASAVAHRQADSNSRTGLLSALLEPAAGGEVDASWQQPAGATPDVTTQPGSSSSRAAVAASSRCVRFGPLPPSKDVWLQQLREMPPQRKQRFLDKLRHTQRRVWLLWRQRSGALRCQQQQQAQEQQEGAGGGGFPPGSEAPALSWPQQRLWLARGAAAGSGKPAGKRERPGPGNTSHSSDSSDDGDPDQDVPASPVKKQQLLWCNGTSGGGSVAAPAHGYAVPACCAS